jgi:lipopolysaccharide biosynthesis protein
MEADPRLIAFYLPQFHPIPENDEWWGRGFTEWTNTAKAKPLFRGHYQPHVPADLGFYDLRVPESRAAQAAMAREYGVEAFCYYHYWFAGKRLLERPLDEVIASGEPDLPFCICWANQTWTGIWHGAPNRILMEQTYPGMDDHERHFESLLPALTDRRYLTVDGKPLLMIYEPTEIPDVAKVMEFWRNLASKAGLPGLHLVAWRHAKKDWEPEKFGFDASSSGLPRHTYGWRQPVRRIRRMIEKKLGRPMIYAYEHVAEDLRRVAPKTGVHYPCVVPNWDNSPRSGANGLVLTGSTPELFRKQLKDAIERVRPLPPERRIVFIKSWNEWAEGNHMEPDLRYGHAYLQAVRDELEAHKNGRGG